MLPRETRNQSRLKDPKNSGVDKPSLENTQDEPIKKLKTEKNSQSKNVLLHNAHAHESLHLLRSIASENHEFDNIHETMDALQLILEYKYRSRKVVFTKDLFQRKVKNNVTPSIFAKKNLQIRLNRPQNAMQLAFENYLNLVAQLYYKATHTLSDVYSIIDSNQFSLNGEDQKPVIQLKRGRKPGRKAKPKNQPKIALENPGTPEGSIDTVEEEEEKQAKEQEPKPEIENINGMLVECIDQLVSPLKVDYIFEKWTPKEIAIFEAGLCKYGKEFSYIQFLIQTKTINQVIEFYFIWKTTNHYKIWKYHKNIENKSNHNSWL